MDIVFAVCLTKCCAYVVELMRMFSLFDSVLSFCICFLKVYGLELSLPPCQTTDSLNLYKKI